MSKKQIESALINIIFFKILQKNNTRKSFFLKSLVFKYIRGGDNRKVTYFLRVNIVGINQERVILTYSAGREAANTNTRQGVK